MRYRITVEPDYVNAELFDRKTAEETQAFLAAVTLERATTINGCGDRAPPG